VPDSGPEEIVAGDLKHLRALLGEVPFARFLGIELVEATHGSVTLRLEIRPELIQNQGLLHGGAMASLIDTATAFAIVAQLTRAENFTTVDLNVHYLKAVTEGSVTCKARILKAGRRLLTISAEAHDDAGNLAAVALSTYARLVS